MNLRNGMIFLFTALSSMGLAHAADAPTNLNLFVDLSKKLIPSVVNISTLAAVGGARAARPYGYQEDRFHRFFEEFFKRGYPGGEEEDEEEDRPSRNKGKRPLALGTGFIIDEAGLILTNSHVVEGADEIQIQFSERSDEEATIGEVVGRDPELDLALIRVKVKQQKLVPVVLGDSDRLEVGEYVIAVGNPFGQGHSVTHGIISAKDRKSPDFAFAKYLQTDAPINPGNSGGPLANTKGEVIGINNAIDARAQGIGFAIPINAVKAVLAELKSKGSVARGYIGILVNELSPEVAEQIGVPKKMKGPFVAHVYPGQPAEKAGLRAYDVIREINGKKVGSAGELIEEITRIPVGKVLKIQVTRGGKELSFDVTAGKRPSAEGQARNFPPPKKTPPRKPPSVETGLNLEELTPEIAEELGISKGLKGLIVESVAYGSSADRAGLLRGDLILEVNRKGVTKVDDFFSLVKEKKSYLLRIRRPDAEGRDLFTVIVLDLKP